MRATLSAIILLLLILPARAQESFPATHLARLDILEPHAGAGTVGGIAIVAIDAASTSLRISVAVPSDAPDTIMLVRRSPLGGSEQVIVRYGFPPETSTITFVLPPLPADALAAIDSGLIWLSVDRSSDGAAYAEGPIQPLLSAVAPEPSGSAVVPPLGDDDGVAHFGLAYDAATGSARYSAWWLDLDGAPTAARIRRGSIGTNGPVVHELAFTEDSEQSIGIWPSVSADDVAAMVAGELYFEVTTDAHPEGAIRGQIHPIEGFTAALEAENETPPLGDVDANGSAFLLITAHGTAEVFNKLQGVVADMTGPITMAHIHRGQTSESGPPVVTLHVPAPYAIDLELASGSAGGAMPDAVVTEIRAERTYVNVHSAAFLNGEARGQLIPARTNLPRATSSAPVAISSTQAVSARFDAAGDAIVVVLTSARARRIALCGITGETLRRAECDGLSCRIDASGLASGPYLLRVDGAAAVPVMIRR